MIFLALIYLAFISLGLPDSLLGASWPLMVQGLQVPVGYAGILSITVSIGTIVSSLFSHLLIRKWGTGVVTVISVCMTAVALLGYSMAPSFIWLFVSAIPLGLGAGAVDSGLNEFVAEHYKAKHMNWLHCFWGVGAMLGPVLISTLTRAGFGWRNGYFSISMLQFALVGLLLFSLPAWKKREQPKLHPAGGTASERTPHVFSPFKFKGIGYALGAFFLYSAVENTVILWGASYLVNAKGLLPEDAAGWVSIFFLGITLGRFLSGLLSVKISNQNMITLGILILLAGLCLMALPLPTANRHTHTAANCQCGGRTGKT